MRNYAALLVAVVLPSIAGCQYVGDYVEVRRAKADVSSAMLDPSSAAFRGIAHAEYGAGRVVCGEVNGSNAFGAMVGFRPFIYVAPLMRVADGRESGTGISRCCGALMDHGKVSGVKSTADVAECSGVEPAMPLI